MCRAAENSLGLFALSAQSAESPLVLADIDRVTLEEVGCAIVHDLIVEVLASQVGITSCGLHLEDSIVDGKQ